MADQRRSRPKIEPHPLVEALVPDAGKPPERTTKMHGYPGASPSAGATRLWLDLDLTSYADVPDEAILYSRTLPDDEGTLLWVRADAPISYGSVSSHEAQAEFLAGGITATHLGAAAGGGMGFPALPTLLGCPPPTLLSCPPPTLFPCGYTVFPGCPPPPTLSHTLLPCCPPPTLYPVQCPTHTIACKPSVLIRCPSTLTICPTQTALCHVTTTVACKPSVVLLCPSQQLICPTSPAICNVSIQCPSLIDCPTRFGCPSVAVPCETTPGCPLPTAGCPYGGDPGGGGGFGY
jgi:hypothetical protein